MAKNGTDRKKAQRERDRTQGTKRIEIRLSAEVAKGLEEACRIRGGTGREPYTLAEYVELLIIQDRERLDLLLTQMADVPCQKCGKTIPEGGCGGVHRWERDCLHTLDERALLLTEPKRLTESDFN